MDLNNNGKEKGSASASRRSAGPADSQAIVSGQAGRQAGWRRQVGRRLQARNASRQSSGLVQKRKAADCRLADRCRPANVTWQV